MKIGVAKTGNIASSLVLELLLDERADRKDIDVRVVSSGAKMTPEACKGVLEEITSDPFDLFLYCTPNPSTPGPREVIKGLKDKRAIVVADAKGLKVREELEEMGLGYVFITGDALIGARREFLDPTEMSIFNADMLKVLSVTGAFRALQEAIGETIEAAKEGKDLLPHLVVDAATALGHSGIENPNALAKAREAYEMAERVGELNFKACFILKDPVEYIPAVAAAHEMLHDAAMLADEAREIQKKDDTVLRTPHSPEGKVLRKKRLMDKPSP